MKFLFDLFPLLLFFGTFKLYGIYAATLAAIIGSALQVGLYWLKTRSFEKMHLITLAIIVVMGGLTLFLKDDRFIKWKPTILYWIFSVIILASQFIGKSTIMEKLMGSQLSMPKAIWSKVNLSWGLFFLVAGLLNVYVAFYYGGSEITEQARTDLWVNFKVFGLMILTLAFAIIQALMIAKHIKPDEEESK